MTHDDALERASLLMAAGRDEQAEAELHRCLADEPGLPEAWARIGIIRARRGELSEGLEAVDRALAADPSYVYALVGRCLVLHWLERPDEALRAADEVVRLSPEEWIGHQIRAGSLADQEDWPAALAAARRAVELAPENAGTHYAVGFAAAHLGDHETAEESLSAALRLDPEDGETLAQLTAVRARGHRVRHLRRTGETLTGYADALALDLDNDTARQKLLTLLWLIAAKSRWLGALCLLIGLIGAAAAGAGSGEPPQPGELTPRLVTLAVIGAVCGLCGWLLAASVPRRLHRPLLRYARRSRAILLMAAATAALLLSAVCVVAIPWSQPAVLPVFILAPTALALLLSALSRRLLRRSTRGEGDQRSAAR